MKDNEKQSIKKETIKGNSLSRTKKTTVVKTLSEKKKREDVVVESSAGDLLDNKQQPFLKEIVVEKKVGFNVIEVVLIMIITLLFGGLAGSFIGYTARGNKNDGAVDGVKVPTEFTEFLQVYDTIKSEYYGEIDTSKMIESGIKGMIQFLGDPFSTYFSAEESEVFNEKLEGEYVGIGAEITLTADGKILVSHLLDNSSAGNAGVLVGDQFQKVDGQDINGMNLSEISKLLKGSEGTNVNVTLKRGEEEKEVSIVRRSVEIESVKSRIEEKDGKKVGVISIDIFAANSFSQFEKEFVKIQSEVSGIIVDVRDNTGGHLNVVEQIASLFVTKGNIIYQLETKGVKQPIYSTRTTNIKLPVVVLMNGNSASASEILAVALKESYGATLVGEKTFGKGTVQTTKEFSNGSTIKYTFQKWLTPNGNWIHGKGISPDVEISMDKAFYENPSIESDNQLQKAIDNILGK